MCKTTVTHINDDPLAEVVVMWDGVEVVLAGVLRILVHALLFMARDLRQRSNGNISLEYHLCQFTPNIVKTNTGWIRRYIDIRYTDVLCCTNQTENHNFLTASLCKCF